MMKVIYSLKAMKLLLNRIKKSAIFLCIFSIICMNSVPAFAVSDANNQKLKDLKATLAATVPTAVLDQCRETLVPVYDVELLMFLGFLEENFQNKSADSSLINIAIARYGEYKNYLISTFASLTPKYSSDTGMKTYEREFDAYQLCYDITEAYIKLAKDQMIMHIKNNVAQKKTSMMLEKYKAIGEKLRDLNLAIAQMYSLFTTFRKKLPFFVEDCQ